MSGGDWPQAWGVRKEVSIGMRMDYVSPVLRDWLDRSAREVSIREVFSDGSERWTWLGYDCPSCGTRYYPESARRLIESTTTPFSRDWHCPSCGR